MLKYLKGVVVTNLTIFETSFSLVVVWKLAKTLVHIEN